MLSLLPNVLQFKWHIFVFSLIWNYFINSLSEIVLTHKHLMWMIFLCFDMWSTQTKNRTTNLFIHKKNILPTAPRSRPTPSDIVDKFLPDTT